MDLKERERERGSEAVFLGTAVERGSARRYAKFLKKLTDISVEELPKVT